MKTDVLIIGGGLSAVCAAYEIIENSHLQVDLLSWGGGASPFIHGFCLPVGAGDSAQLFYEDTVASGYGQGRTALIRRLCDDSLQLPRWFESLGLDIDREGGKPRLIKSLGSSVARIAGIGNNTGPVLLKNLKDRLTASGRCKEHRNYRAVELIKKDGAIQGARCYNKDTDCFEAIGARVVILATGGFGKLFPESTNSADIGGDGCAMAYRAGCRLTDMEFIQFEPSAAVWPPQLVGKSIITTMFYEGAVLRGGDGQRFMTGPEGERVGKDLQAKAIAAQLRKDNATPHGGVWFDATQVPENLWNTVYKPYLNRYLTYGIDMRKEPVEIAPAAHTTCGGVLIDENCRTGVPGLLACGEVTGGLHGANRLGGNAGLEVMVFGRVAGKTAIEEVTAQAPDLEETVSNKSLDIDLQQYRGQLQQLLRKKLGVIRCREELEQGVRETGRMLTALDIPDWYEAKRLYNDVLTAHLAFVSAQNRKESIGCHYKLDGQKQEQPYSIILSCSDQGLHLEREWL